MRIARFVLTSALLLTLSLLSARSTSAAPSASGSYQFNLGDQYLKYVKLDATQTDPSGAATGSMYFSDDAAVVDQDVDGTGVPRAAYKGYYVSAAVDQLIVNKNQAILSGVVRDSSIQRLIGQRVLLTVEDNGDNTRVPDRVTWGAYNFVKRDWTPSDAEWKEDPGVGLRWWATDYEVKDDRGYAMPLQETETDASTYPASAYAYADAQEGVGDITVVP